MDNRERANDLGLSVRVAMEGEKSTIWTALPVIIESFDPAANTCTCQVALEFEQQRPDGSWAPLRAPLLLDCPVVFPAGGGFALTFPIAKGDEALAVFAARCIDAWWQSGGVQAQAEFRMHDMSDGFLFPGVRSKPRVLGSYDASATELRSDSGDVAVRVSQSGLSLRAPGCGIILGGGVVAIQGALTINGAPYALHSHSNVENGPDTSGGVVL